MGGARREQLPCKASAPRSVCWAGRTGGFQDGSLPGLAPWHWVFSQGPGLRALLPPHVGLSSSQAALAPARHSGWLPRASIPGDRKWQLPVSEDLDPAMGTAPRLLNSFVKRSQGQIQGEGRQILPLKKRRVKEFGNCVFKLLQRATDKISSQGVHPDQAVYSIRALMTGGWDKNLWDEQRCIISIKKQPALAWERKVQFFFSVRSPAPTARMSPVSGLPLLLHPS